MHSCVFGVPPRRHRPDVYADHGDAPVPEHAPLPLNYRVDALRGGIRVGERMGDRDVPGSIPSKKSTISMNPGVVDPGVVFTFDWD